MVSQVMHLARHSRGAPFAETSEIPGGLGCRDADEFEAAVASEVFYCKGIDAHAALLTSVFILISPLIEFENVFVQRGNLLALNGLNLRINSGEHVAILGPNGSGKSTLIKTITRECYPLIRPDSGLRILGQENWNIFDLRSHLGLVSNDLMVQCTRDITGRELVLSGFFGSIGIWPNHHVTAEMEQSSLRAMERLEVGRLANRWLDELSSGEARRLLIARALIHHPSTLLLDEPTTSLDLPTLHEVRNHLRGLASSGVGLLLVTHHLDDIIPEIERVVLLRNGAVEADGRKEDILQSDRLSDLFRSPLEVFERDGFYHAW
jgi:iron complex transport system ATP-binding protein